MTDPPGVLPRADEVSAALRMLGAAQTSTLVLTGEAGAGKSMLAALVYRRLEAVAQARQASIRHFAWLSLGPNATLPEVIAAIVGSIDVESGRAGAGSRDGVSSRAGADSWNVESDRAGASPAPTIYGRFPDFFMRRAEQQVELLRQALCRPQESAFVVLDQFEELLDAETSQGLVGRGAIPLFLDMLQSDLGASRVLLTCRNSPYDTQNDKHARVRSYLVSRISLPEGVALLQQRGVQGAPQELSLIWQRCAGHVYGLVLFSTMYALGGFSLGYLLNSPDYAPLWGGEVTLNLVDAVYNFLNPSQRTLLRSLCLFSEPVPVEAVIIATTGEGYSAVDVAPFIRELAALTRLSLVKQAPYENGEPGYLLHPLIRQYTVEHYLDGNEGHASGDLGVTTEPDPLRGNPEGREIALAAGHMRVTIYYSRLAQERCPPRRQRSGPQDVEPLLAMVHHLCLGWHWQQAYDLLTFEELHESMIQWGAWNTLIRLYTAMVPPLGVVIRYDEGQILSYLGMLYGRLGDSQQSRFYFEQALGTQREIGDQYGEAVTLTNQGEVLRTMGQTQQARANFEQALHSHLSDAYLQSVALHNLGLLYQNQKDYEQAMYYYQQSLKLAQSLQERANEGLILTNMGMLFYEQGRLIEAIGLLFPALQVRQSVQDRTAGSLVLFLQTLEQKMGQEAFALLRQQALDRQEQILARLGVVG
jgi:tetratricopeptide (TPR) repeat protein